jgi:hypothetical protein
MHTVFGFIQLVATLGLVLWMHDVRQQLKDARKRIVELERKRDEP